MRVAYLGPEGTYTHAALRASAPAGIALQERACATIPDVVAAVADRTAERGIVPIENALEGSVNATLDALAFESEDVVIVAETVQPIHHCLITRPGTELAEVTAVVSHPQALAQCAGFLRRELPHAGTHSETSTAAAVRAVLACDRPWAALGPRSAAERYGATVLCADVEDLAGNATRFAWLARRGSAAAATGAAGTGAWKTALAFWPRGSDVPGWLVECLTEFSGRGINLTRIESRPRKVGLGEYVFFVDLAGRVGEPRVTEALAAIRGRVSELRVLGSFPAA